MDLYKKINNDIWQKNLVVLCVAVFLGSISFGAVAPYFPIYVKELGVEKSVELWAGVLYASSYLTGAIAAPFWGVLSDKHGRKIMTIRASFSSAVVYALISIINSHYQLLILQLIVGALSGFVPASVALIATIVPEEKLGTSIGFIYSSSALGSVIGPLLGGIFATLLGIRNVFRISAFILLITSIIILVWLKEEKIVLISKGTSIIEGLKKSFSNKMIFYILLAIVGIQISMVIINPVLPLHITSIVNEKNSKIATGIMFSLMQLAIIITAPIWGKIGEKVGYRKILILGLILAALMNIFQIFFNSIIYLGILIFGYGVCIAGLIPATNTLLAKSVSKEFRGRAFGISTTANQLGVFIGPLLGGLIGSYFGIKLVFIFSAIVLVITTLVIIKMDDKDIN